VPLLLFVPSAQSTVNAVSDKKLLLSHWDLIAGKISFGKESRGKDIVNNKEFQPAWGNNNVASAGKTMVVSFKRMRDVLVDARGGRLEHGDIVADIHDGTRVESLLLKTPIPADAGGPYPLLVSGTPDNFSVLAGYDYRSRDAGGITGKLLFCTVDGHDIQWRQIEGEYLNPIAGYIPDMVKSGDKIYLDGKSGLHVKVIDIKRDPLKVTDYTPANELVRQVSDEYADAPAPPPLQFGAYQDIVLVSTGDWIWALQNDTYIGKIHVDYKGNKLTVYKDDRITDEKRPLNTPFAIQLPKPSGQYLVP
jgi:hypothetical protein